MFVFTLGLCLIHNLKKHWLPGFLSIHTFIVLYYHNSHYVLYGIVLLSSQFGIRLYVKKYPQIEDLIQSEYLLSMEPRIFCFLYVSLTSTQFLIPCSHRIRAHNGSRRGSMHKDNRILFVNKIYHLNTKLPTILFQFCL